MNNEGNILSAVSNTRLETRVETASHCFAIIIRNNTFFSPLRSLSLFSSSLGAHGLASPPPPILFNPFSLCYSFPFYAASFATSASFSSFFPPPPFLSFLLRFTPLPCFLCRRQSVETRNNPLPPSGVWWILFRTKQPIERTDLHSLARDERDIFNSETRHLL